MRLLVLVCAAALLAGVLAQPNYISQSEIRNVQHHQRGRHIHLAGGIIDTNEAPTFLNDQNHERINSHRHVQRNTEEELRKLFLVHFRAGTNKQELEQHIGSELGGYIPYNTFTLYATDAVAEKALNAPGVLWVGDWMPEFKTHPKAFQDLHDVATSVESIKLRNELVLTVIANLAEDSARTKEDCKQIAQEWENTIQNTIMKSVAELRRFSVQVAASSKDVIRVTLEQRAFATAATKAAAMVALKDWVTARWEVLWVEMVPEYRAHNHWASWIVQSAVPNVTDIIDHGLDGTGQLVACADTGIDWDNCFFYDPAVPVPLDTTSSTHRKIFAYVTTFGDNKDNFNHGTPCMGTVAGNALNTDTSKQAYATTYNGIASNAKIAFVDINSGGQAYTPPDDFTDLFSLTYNIDAKLHLLPWGSPATWYTSQEKQTDAYHNDHTDFLAILSAGNDGETNSINNPGECKNGVTVGSTTSAWENLMQRRSTNDFVPALQALVLQVCNSTVTSLFDNVEFCASFSSNAPCASLQQQACNTFSLAGGPEAVCCSNTYASQICCPSTVQTNVANNPLLFNYWVGSTDSSRGPSFDGRIKPDVVAPGNRIISAQSDMDVTTFNCGIYPAADDAVSVMQGSSFAASVIAGAGTLARQYYTDGYFPFGVRTPGSGFNPSGALVKATLINSGQPLNIIDTTGRGNYITPSLPDYYQGFGRVQLDQTLYFTNSTFKLQVADGPSDQVGTGDVARHCFQVLDNASWLKVTVVWTDPPASLGAGITLVNNLDLVVIDSTGREWRSNFGTTFDGLNNVEQVWIKSPPAGQYIANIYGYHVVTGTKQRYSLVATGQFATLSSCANVCPNGCSLKGTCSAGKCTCQSPYVGVDCSLTPCPNDCSNNGYCDGSSGTCVCGTGWYGTDCSKPGVVAPPPPEGNVTVVISSNATSSGGVETGVTIGVAIAAFFLGLLPAAVGGVFLGRKWTRDKILKSIPTVGEDEPMQEGLLGGAEGDPSSSAPFQSSSAMAPDQAWAQWASKA